jgi:hypothetical protein
LFNKNIFYKKRAGFRKSPPYKLLFPSNNGNLQFDAHALRVSFNANLVDCAKSFCAEAKGDHAFQGRHKNALVLNIGKQTNLGAVFSVAYAVTDHAGLARK